MYKRFEAELKFANMTKKDLAEKTGIRYDTLVLKLAGKSPITVEEAQKMKDAINTTLSIEELFKR